MFTWFKSKRVTLAAAFAILAHLATASVLSFGTV